MSVYADSSFFVSHYLQDRHSAEVDRRLSLQPRVWFTPFQHVELVHAVYQHVFRGFISAHQAQAVLDELERDCEGSVWLLADQPKEAFELCLKLAGLHVAKLGVRTLDSLHVATAQALGATRFWTFDQRQARLAEAEGLATN